LRARFGFSGAFSAAGFAARTALGFAAAFVFVSPFAVTVVALAIRPL
jgi:hypothetical protein